MAKPKNPLKHEAEIGLLTGRLERQKETVKELRTQLKKDTHTIHQFRTENIRVQNELEAALARITRRDRTIKAMQDRAKAQRDNHREITTNWSDECSRLRRMVCNKDDINTKLTEALAKNTRERLDLVEQLREAKLVLSHRKSIQITAEDGATQVLIHDDPYVIKEPILRPRADLSRTYHATSTAPDMANISKENPGQFFGGVK